MTKVKVSKEVAAFIKEYGNTSPEFYWEDILLTDHASAWSKNYSDPTIKEEAKCMKNISPMQLAEILINGHEVEKTPEEEVLEYYNVHKLASQLVGAKQNADNCMYAIRKVLTILRIKIDGINGK